MKWIIISVLLLLLSGCATDTAYGVAKTVYVGGKAVVIANADLLDDETIAKLEKVDDYATRYDNARTVLKEALDVVDTNNTSTVGTGGK